MCAGRTIAARSSRDQRSLRGVSAAPSGRQPRCPGLRDPGFPSVPAIFSAPPFYPSGPRVSSERGRSFLRAVRPAVFCFSARETFWVGIRDVSTERLRTANRAHNQGDFTYGRLFESGMPQNRLSELTNPSAQHAVSRTDPAILPDASSVFGHPRHTHLVHLPPTPPPLSFTSPPPPPFTPHPTVIRAATCALPKRDISCLS